ncbi:hypothetical protein NMY22_g16917 [Coprinellus aureogranulatus]|nr:hypothetical protein NMY22_g16917 [Coprinellus aureogranulatus]
MKGGLIDISHEYRSAVDVLSVLEVVHPDFHLSPDARALVNDILNQTVNAIALRASKLATEHSSSIVAVRNLEAAVKQIFPGSLRALALSAGVKATQKSRSTSPNPLLLAMGLNEVCLRTRKPNEAAPSSSLILSAQ